MNRAAKTFAILTDTTKCTGCEACVAACKEANGLGRDQPWPWQARVDDLSSTRFTTVLRRPGPRFVRQQCRHCQEPACVSACLVGALQKTDQGPVVYDSNRCMGCRYCMMACPYGIPRYDWSQAVPYIRKCTLCYQRLKEGKQPACTEACPAGATLFGTRAEMLAVARERIREHPNQYVDRVFGEHEIGGTCVLYISDVPLGFLGWKPALGDTPLPKLTWASLIKVPPVMLGMAGLMTGVYFIIGRRMKLQAEAAAQGLNPSPSASEGHDSQPTQQPGSQTPREEDRA